MSWARNRSRYGFSATKRLELGDERKVAAERELRVDPLLDRRESQLLEALDLDTCERLELEVGERPPSHRSSAARSASAAAAASPVVSAS